MGNIKIHGLRKEKRKFFFVLLRLAEMGAYQRSIKVSTFLLAEKIGLSQQTASRYLLDLQRLGWIERSITRNGGLIRITEAGRSVLREVFSRLSVILESKIPSSLMFEGVVFSGLGEGSYYVTREAYRRQFIEKLGFDPYPGTLNVKLLSEHDVKARAELDNYPAIEIEGFKDKDRTYGPVRCFRALINNEAEGAVVCALRSHYNSSVIEIISPFYLRGKLKLNDGSRVRVEVFPNIPSKKGET